MQIYSIAESSRAVGVEPLQALVASRAQLLVPATFSVPRDAGRKSALARLVPNLFGGSVPTVLWITGWGVWPSSENWDLFYGYRRSLGEDRLLIDAPVHVDSSSAESLASILSMVLFFGWDAQVLSTTGELMVTISHDEWLELRAVSDAVSHEAIQALKHFGLEPLLADATG